MVIIKLNIAFLKKVSNEMFFMVRNNVLYAYSNGFEINVNVVI